MNVDGGGLYFESDLDNDKINAAIDETLRRVQGLSDGTVAAGQVMDDAFQQAAGDIEQAFQDIDKMAGIHQAALRDLENEYARLGDAAGNAFMSGKDDEYRALTEKQQAIKGEIAVRKELLKEIEQQADALAESERKMEAEKKKVEENANVQVSMRTRIRALREEMMLLIDQGIDEQSEAYRRLEAELGRLTDIQGDVQQQGRMLANDEAQFQGIITGLSGLAGGFSAVTGAVSLFAGENENLQKIMVKVQSLMAITIGLQQVAQALNKDSAFSLVTLNGLKEWWNGLLAKAVTTQTAETAATVANTAAETANTAATAGNTVAQGANTVATGAQAAAAVAGTAANIGLAGAFRMVGLAIKSIPVFGWILAGISALIGLVAALSSKAREAKKAQEEFNKELVEGSYKSIGAIENLSTRWNRLGDDLDAKKKFIEANKKAFDELGVSVRDVVDAENLLNAGKQAFIDAQIAKAKAAIYLQQTTEKVKKQMELEAEIAKMSDTKTRVVGGMYGQTYTYEVENKAKARKQQQLNDLKAEIQQGYENAAAEESAGLKRMEELGIAATNTYAAGTVGAIEQAISAKQEALKLLTNNDEYKVQLAEITALQKQLEGITGKKTGGGGSTSKDPFLEKLEKQKREYERFMKWVNSGDQTLVKAANAEFEGILKQGATYIDYLKRQREIIESVDVSNRTKAQNAQLRTLNNQIAEETKKTVLESFNAELSEQLNNARTVAQMLAIIEQRRKDLANDGTELDNGKKETLDDAEQDVVKQAKEETDALLENYASYLDKKVRMGEQYANDMALLQKRMNDAETEAEKQSVQRAMDNRTTQYEKDTKNDGDENYTDLLKDYASFEQKKQAIIDEYDEKRKTAQEHGNDDMIARLNEAQAKAISSLASNELMGTDVWANLFGNLDELTAQQITTLVNEIESKFDTLSGVFNPIDLSNVRDKLNEAKAILVQDNPFKQIGVSIRAIFNDAGDDSKDSAGKIKKNWQNLANATEKSFDFVTDAINSCDFLKDAIGDVGATAISSLATVAATSIAVATAIKTAEKASVVLAIIQAALVVVQAVVNVVKSIFGNNDKKIEKEIQRHAAAVRDLQNAYNGLAWTIEKALGGAVYNNQKAAIANMEQQKKHLQSMWEGEINKKKTDWGKVADYKEQYAQLERDIQDMLDEITNDILQTDAKTLAGELGDALAEAFGKGEDAAKAFEETVNNVIKNAILNQLKKNFLETQMQGALNNLEKSMGYWNGDDFVFDGLTEAEIAAFKNQVAGITNQFNQAMSAYEEVFKGIVEPEEPTTSLSGAVKGASQESIDLLTGQTNAVRVNQVQSIEILRAQLLHLASIAAGIGTSNRHLESIDKKMSSSNYDPLRSQGLS